MAGHAGFAFALAVRREIGFSLTLDRKIDDTLQVARHYGCIHLSTSVAGRVV